MMHEASKEETSDIVRYLISRFLPGRIEMIAKTQTGQKVAGNWNCCRCDHPKDNYLSESARNVETHMRKQHESMREDIKALGVFWGTIHTLIKNNPRVTIAEVLGQGCFWECRTEGCHRAFDSKKALRTHFSLIHAAYTQEGWEASMRCLAQGWSPSQEDLRGGDGDAGANAGVDVDVDAHVDAHVDVSEVDDRNRRENPDIPAVPALPVVPAASEAGEQNQNQNESQEDPNAQHRGAGIGAGEEERIARRRGRGRNGSENGGSEIANGRERERI
jgi:hypothetical protein